MRRRAPLRRRGRPAGARRPAALRRAVATVELAVCLPVLTLMVFGSIQACDLIYLRHSLNAAAYEGSLELARSEATTASVNARIAQVLSANDVSGGGVTLEPAGFSVEDAKPGTPVTVRVNAPITANLSLSGFFPMPPNVSVHIACTR